MKKGIDPDGEAVVIEVKRRSNMDVHPWAVSIGRWQFGRIYAADIARRFRTKTRANKVAAFLAAEYVEDGQDVLVIGNSGKQRLLRGA